MARKVAGRVRGAAAGWTDTLRSPVGFVPLFVMAAIWKQAPAGWPWVIGRFGSEGEVGGG